MATIGLSKPYYALYQESGGTVTYSGGGLIGKATEMSLELEGGGRQYPLRRQRPRRE